MDHIKELFSNPAFTAILGSLIGLLGGVFSSLITWRKDIALVQEQSRFDYFKSSISDLRDFISQHIVNIDHIGVDYDQHDNNTREFYRKRLENLSQQEVLEEWKACLKDYSAMIVAFMSKRHLFPKEDRQFLDKTYENLAKGMRKEQKTQKDYIEAIADFRILTGTMYVSMLKTLERISDRIIG